MRNVQITLTYSGIILNFLDAQKAQTAYDMLTAAMKKHKPYSNDKSETVTIDLEAGEGTYLVSELKAVEIMGDDFALLRDRLEAEKVARTMREELGLPQLHK